MAESLPPGYIESPDRWVLIQTDYGLIILSSWFGSYTSGESWRLSTPLVHMSHSAHDDHYLARTKSGSAYRVNKKLYGMTSYAGDVFAYRKSQIDPSSKFELVPEVEFESVLESFIGDLS